MVNFFLASAQKSFFHPLGVSSYTIGVEKKPSASESRKKLQYPLLQRRSHYSYKLQVESGKFQVSGHCVPIVLICCGVRSYHPCSALPNREGDQKLRFWWWVAPLRTLFADETNNVGDGLDRPAFFSCKLRVASCKLRDSSADCIDMLWGAKLSSLFGFAE